MEIMEGSLHEKVLNKWEDKDFFKTDETRKRAALLENIKSNGSFKEILECMNAQYNLLFTKHEVDTRGGYSLFLFSWNQWIYNLVYGPNGPDPILIYDTTYEKEVLNLMHWIGWRVIDERARAKRFIDLDENIENKKDKFFSLKRSYDRDISLDQAKKSKLRHLKTDRLYTMNRIVGGVMGEMWGVNKKAMKIKDKIKKGKKPLTKKQREKAHKLYKIALSLRNEEQFDEDLPAAIKMINKGGLFLAHTTLFPFVSRIIELVVQQYRLRSNGPTPRKTIKETVKIIKEDESFKEQFHKIVEEIPAIVENGFSSSEIEEFRVIFQRKLVHAKVADLIRGEIRRRNEKKGKRNVGGQNLRCMLYGVASKSKKVTAIKKAAKKSKGWKRLSKKTVAKDVNCSSALAISPSRGRPSMSGISRKLVLPEVEQPVQNTVVKETTQQTLVKSTSGREIKSKGRKRSSMKTVAKDVNYSSALAISPSRDRPSTSGISRELVLPEVEQPVLSTVVKETTQQTLVKSRSGREIKKRVLKDFHYN